MASRRHSVDHHPSSQRTLVRIMMMMMMILGFMMCHHSKRAHALLRVEALAMLNPWALWGPTTTGAAPVVDPHFQGENTFTTTRSMTTTTALWSTSAAAAAPSSTTIKDASSTTTTCTPRTTTVVSTSLLLPTRSPSAPRGESSRSLSTTTTTSDSCPNPGSDPTKSGSPLQQQQSDPTEKDRHPGEDEEEEQLQPQDQTTTTAMMLLDPLVLCGPSGVGKGTLLAQYLHQHGGRDHFGFTVSHTTRAPRPGEVPGRDYHFVAHDTMQQLLAEASDENQNNEEEGGSRPRSYFLEYAHVHGNWYGTSWQAMRDVQNQGRRCLLDIDVQGVQRLKQLQQRYPGWFQPKYIFLAPPSLAALEVRLRQRNTESEDVRQRRLAQAAAEIDYGLTPGNFDAVIVNDDLNRAVQEFHTVVSQLYGLPPSSSSSMAAPSSTPPPFTES